MTPEKVKSVCDEYRAILDVRGARVKRIEGDDAHRLFLTGIHREDHLRFMCDEIPSLVDQGRIEKAMRWLGFLQGVVWALGIETLDTAKRRNMPPQHSREEEDPT